MNACQLCGSRTGLRGPLCLPCRTWTPTPKPVKTQRERRAELGVCLECGRPLTDPVSIDRGIGPDCWRALGHE